MKHSIKITLLLLAMFFTAQIIGLGVTASYSSYKNETGKQAVPEIIAPPEDANPYWTTGGIIFAICLGVVLMLFLMKFKAELFFRIWFFLVVVIAISLTLNALLIRIPMNNLSTDYKFLIAMLIALPLASIKIFARNIKIHNLTELIIYPGVAYLFIPILNWQSTAILLILISLYDMYAVWHSGIMQKMAKYQINKVKIFAGLFIPYVNKKDRDLIRSSRKNSKLKNKKIKVSVAILGGGDIVFPIIFAGVIFLQFGLLPALAISVGALFGLAFLFYLSEKGKFYPAMPFITAGCFIAFGISYIIGLL